jgi:hypothetical protein
MIFSTNREEPTFQTCRFFSEAKMRVSAKSKYAGFLPRDGKEQDPFPERDMWKEYALCRESSRGK